MYGGVVGSSSSTSRTRDSSRSTRRTKRCNTSHQQSFNSIERKQYSSSRSRTYTGPKNSEESGKAKQPCKTDEESESDDDKEKQVDKKIRHRRKVSYYKRFVNSIRQLWTDVKFGSDSEEEDIEREFHHRPDDINSLCKTTHFSKTELQRLYRSFKDKCPTGVITESSFKDIYCEMFPKGASTSQYAHYVFSTLDKQGEGFIYFEDFITLHSRLARGSLADRLCWIFSLYDLNGDGYISKPEMTEVVQAVYDLLGKTTVPVDGQTVEEKVTSLFEMFDANRDGFISLEEFVDACSKDFTVVHNLDTMTISL